MYLLKTVGPNGESYGGFRWPLEEGAEVESAEWNAEPVCGGGLHGLPKGEGDGSLLDWSENARWLVFEAPDAEVVEFEKKAKCRHATVVHVGDQRSATDWLMAHGCRGAIVGATVMDGDRGQATAGDGGQATAGDYGRATAGDRGRATAGDGGQATAGDYGRATAGDYGRATAGDRGRATAGARGVICIAWPDGDRTRFAIGYVNENGIEPNVAYKVEDGKLVECQGKGDNE